MKGSRGIEIFRSIKETYEKERKIYTYQIERGMKVGVAWLGCRGWSSHAREGEGKTGLRLREEEEEAEERWERFCAYLICCIYDLLGFGISISGLEEGK